MISLRIYSIWSLFLGLAIFSVQGFVLWKGAGNQENLFLLALSLFHFIQAIWFWKGIRLFHFARATIGPRFLLSGLYAFTCVLLQSQVGQDLISDSLYSFFTLYLIVAAVADSSTSIFTLIEIKKFETVEKRKNLISEIFGNWKQLDFEFKNRALFGIYMTLLGLWILFTPNGFLSFFRFIPSLFDFPDSNRFVLGPIHLIGVQVILLGYYNFTAVTYRLKPLIEAGIRGGTITCIFFLLLVLGKILHPIVLLLPLVDLISLGWILVRKIKNSQ